MTSVELLLHLLDEAFRFRVLPGRRKPVILWGGEYPSTKDISPRTVELDTWAMAKKKTAQTAETDLYRPVHDYLVEQGYTVRSEVANCDITAVKDDDLIVIELKRQMCLALVGQAVQRQKISDSVYVAIPRPGNKSKWMSQTRCVRAILRRLEIGLILVGLTPGKPPVEVVFHPLPFERKRRKRVRRSVLREIENRSADFNEGGSCGKKLVTAYRENAIQIACLLQDNGPMSPKQLRDMGTGQKTLSILSSNFYGWFERVDHGVYALGPRGRAELEDYAEVAKQYLGKPKRKSKKK